MMLPKDGHAQDNSKAFAAADSSRFSPNKNGGWKLFNSFVNIYQKDSAQVELILQHDGIIDWKQEQMIGKIIVKCITGVSILFMTILLFYQIK